MTSLVFYTDRIPDKFGGYSIGPIILIRPKYRDDKGLLAHELVHRRQWFTSVGMSTLLYAMSRGYRLWAEVEAYREQLKHYPDDRSWKLAEALATKYDLNLTREEAHSILQGA